MSTNEAEEGHEACEEIKEEESERRGPSGLSINSSTRDKENIGENLRDQDKSNGDEFLCHECKRSLASSPELINITGQPCRRWHPDCFKCMICREPMDKRQSCHVYDDQILCRTDYMRLKRDLSSVKCARCRWPIGASDWVRKAAQHVYHLACFNCDICSRQLNTGEQFIISPADSKQTISERDGPIRLLCRLHFTISNHNGSRRASQDSVAIREHSAGQPSGGCQPIPSGQALQDHEQDDDRKCRRQNKRTLFGSQLGGSSTASGEGTSIIMAQPDHHHQEHASFLFAPSIGQDLSIVTSQSNQHCPSSSNTPPSTTSSSNTTTLLDCRGDSERGGPVTPTGSQSGCGGGSQSKSKRVRTTFTEDQLSILQTHFQIDSNPDGQDLERIATITGLSKRVTQVWFQNSRARQKKYMIKRKPMHGMSTLSSHGHHTIDSSIVPTNEDDEDDDSSNHLRTFEELTQFHRRSNLFVAGLEQLQQRREALEGSTAVATSSEQIPWQSDGRAHHTGQVRDEENSGAQTDEDRLSGISSLSTSEVDASEGVLLNSESPSAGKS